MRCGARDSSRSKTKSSYNLNPPMIVKTCGLQTMEAAQTAIDSGADLLGMIFVPNVSRTVDFEVAKQIVQLVKQKRGSIEPGFFKNLIEDTAGDYYENISKSLLSRGPFTVGVFQNQSIEDILSAVQQTEIDIIQLHGSENKLEYAKELTSRHGIPVISRYLVLDLGKTELEVPNRHLLVLLDGEKGGDGKTLNWDLINEVNKDKTSKFLLAGGLEPENVKSAVKVSGAIGVDVSSGIETDKRKDPLKIRQFVENAKL